MQHTPEGPRSQDPDSPRSGSRDASRARRSAAALAALAVFGASGATGAHAVGHQDAPAPDERPDPADGPVRTVQPGDSLWAVAAVNGLSVEDLMEWNGLSGDAALVPGDTLHLSAPTGRDDRGGAEHSSSAEAPQRDGAAGPPHRTTADEASRVQDPAAEPAQETDRAPEPETAEHRVAAGDTLWSLSLRHEVSVQQLIEVNRLDVAAPLRTGQPLQIPAAPQPETAEVSPDATADESAAGSSVGEHIADDAEPDDETLASARTHLEQLYQRPSPSPEDMQRMVRRTAEDMGVDPALALAHAEQESHFVHRSVSSADAVGTMQVLPSSGEWASGLVGRDLDLLDPQDNVTAGVAIIRENQRLASDLEIGIASYYQGSYGVSEYGMYDDTKAYVREVKARISGWERTR